MEEEISAKKTGIRTGLNTAIFILVYAIIMQVIFKTPDETFGFTTYLFIALGIFNAHRKYKVHNEGVLGFKQGVRMAMLVALIAGLISSIYFYIYIKFIDRSLIKQALEYSRKTWENDGLSTEKLNDMSQMTESLLTPASMAIFNYMGIIFIGFVLSVIISLFTRNNIKTQS